MRLAKPFYRLPVRFDVERLRAEVAALPTAAWHRHPNAIAGNSAARLISVDGGENDEVNGVMLPTPHLRQSPYLAQVLASFGVVWSRSRLLRLAPGATVPQHADINYHWFNRVRLHIPIVTRPEVRFHCGDQSVHMAAGEGWVFDNWRLHRVENPTDVERIHLVADTSGSANFWRLVAGGDAAGAAAQQLAFDPARHVMPMMERTVLAPVMSPGEVDLLALDLRAELSLRDDSAEARAQLAGYHAMLDALCRDWRQLYGLYGTTPDGWPQFAQLRDSVRIASRSTGEGIVVRTNQVAASQVLEARVLRAMLSIPSGSGTAAPATARSSGSGEAVLHRPIFIVAAPRSGSTLLFETLAVSPQFFTFGGEAHWLIEGLADLRPGAPGVESNRLTAQHATEAVAKRVVARIVERFAGFQGPARFLEKTPKNALRVPFFNRIFADAQFIFLWRDPRENISSIMEAWRSGNWKTYNGLAGFDGPWSLLLPPGWRAMNGKPLEEIAAFQWERTNRILLDDLEALGQDRWRPVDYGDLIADPTSAVRRICEFLEIELDSALEQRVSGELPPSRLTQTPPRADKWRRNADAIERVLPSVKDTWDRLRATIQR